MRTYYRIFLGSQSIFFKEYHDKGVIGVNYGFKESLAPYMTESWPSSRDLLKPIYFKYNPNQSPVGAGLSCGALWNLAAGMQRGDVIICPDGEGNYFSAEIAGDYQFESQAELPHQRKVTWRNQTFSRSSMSDNLKKATKATLTIIDVSGFSSEIEALTVGASGPAISVSDKEIEDPSAFVFEEHLEEFLVYNWNQTELSKEYNLVEEDGEVVARQYPTDTGRIDILALSKDKKEYLVIELKKGKSSDAVVGQILRYMGFVKKELAINGENVRGIIIALENDLRFSNALSMLSGVDFYKYRVDFKLISG